MDDGRKQLLFRPGGGKSHLGPVIGTGIVDPIDDFDDSNPPSHPDLLDTLAREFVHHKYDVKFLIRAICASRAYQLSSVQTSPRQTDRRLFATMPVKGLSPAELAASLARRRGTTTGWRPTRWPCPRFMERPGCDHGHAALQKRNVRTGRPRSDNPAGVGADEQHGDRPSTAPGRGNTLSAILDAPFLDSAGRIEMLYLATLSRRPTRAESQRLVKYVEAGGTHSKSKPNSATCFSR